MLYAYLIRFPHTFATASFKERIGSLNSEHYRIILHNSSFCTIEFNHLSKRYDYIIKELAPDADIKLRVPDKHKHRYITIQRQPNAK